ncbi:NAD-dependent succinate-semialdehyde dehydrogenase [Enteractinococcus coprophilus]|uniref:Succinate-semialdehyde dehydrogenase/glutarate-semialdehyde dehydrogenase n=1 Tax=Enteractinococcus coprophilus TaxID=1027633 RepID=A0A543AN27_9MICC|nr:NAD-dependent succinate-semialdehyde dehydrogenase [Enteractinococcus coprophilus]TQL73968.1 succinate-semialdehyde dehydrogenase/glutarate-semialdehyde dehydrogenase [Enteractinococcus coprophilus]
MVTPGVFQTINPATGEVLAEYPTIADGDVDGLVATSREAFASWRSLPIEERAAKVEKLASLLEENADELASIMTKDMGKPLHEAKDETEFSAEIFRYYATNGPKFAADQQVSEDDDTVSYIQRRPVGPLLGIMPWNFPYYQIARFAAPNLVLGNTIILKHAESCPESALAMQRMMDEAGIPEGVYQNVFATHEQISAFIAHPHVQGVSLTGSERAGAAIAEQAGKHLKKAVLELGGSDPYVILSTDDVKAAAEQAFAVRMENMGQACNSNKRMIVMDDIYDDFVSEMVNLASDLKPGDPSQPEDNAYSPLSSEKAAEGLVDQIQRAKAAGATVHVGGDRPDLPGFYVQPTVVTDVPQGSEIYYEEFFGPVINIFRVESDEEALQLANDSQYGLGSAVFATDADRARKFADQLDAGMVGANTSPEESAEVPFGGVKRSGYGRELGPVGMDEFVNKRLFTVKK